MRGKREDETQEGKGCSDDSISSPLGQNRNERFQKSWTTHHFPIPRVVSQMPSYTKTHVTVK